MRRIDFVMDKIVEKSLRRGNDQEMIPQPRQPGQLARAVVRDVPAVEEIIRWREIKFFESLDQLLLHLFRREPVKVLGSQRGHAPEPDHLGQMTVDRLRKMPPV